jgi:alpha-tubulin suppressor-like RCC1 family protein
MPERPRASLSKESTRRFALGDGGQGGLFYRVRMGVRAREMAVLALVACGALGGCAGDDTEPAAPSGPDGGDASVAVDSGGVDASGEDAALDATIDAGDASDASRADASDAGLDASPIAVTAIAGSPSSVDGGSTSFCALLADDSVRCWGNDAYGQTGAGAPASPFVTVVPTEPTGLASGVARIAVGDTHAAATQGGTTLLWGDDSLGQLGNGSNTAAYVPTAVASLAGATSLSLGGEAGCAVIGGAVECWGANTFGDVGNGATAAQLSPTATGVSGTGVAVSQHTCAVTTAGGVTCWGRDDFGQLGRTTVTTCTSANVPCDPAPGATAITSGASQIAVGGAFSCALVAGSAIDAGSGATVQCWGDNRTGALGLGTVDSDVHAAPTTVALLASGTTPTAIAAGDTFLCVLLTSGVVECWGDDTAGQLGDDFVPQATSVPVIAVTGAKAIAAGAKTACALMNDATVQCWGANDQGELGIGSRDTNLHGPTKVMLP